jgi:hypothetical protein
VVKFGIEIVKQTYNLGWRKKKTQFHTKRVGPDTLMCLIIWFEKEKGNRGPDFTLDGNPPVIWADGDRIALGQGNQKIPKLICWVVWVKH